MANIPFLWGMKVRQWVTGSHCFDVKYCPHNSRPKCPETMIIAGLHLQSPCHFT